MTVAKAITNVQGAVEKRKVKVRNIDANTVTTTDLKVSNRKYLNNSSRHFSPKAVHSFQQALTKMFMVSTLDLLLLFTHLHKVHRTASKLTMELHLMAES